MGLFKPRKGPQVDETRIAGLIAQADAGLALNSREGRQSAFAALMEGLQSLPNDLDVPQSVPLFVRLGDVYWQSDDYQTARKAYRDAVSGPGGVGDPAIHLRLGRAEYELGDMDAAADELTRAYMGGGTQMFEGQDPKYLDFLKTRIESGPDGW